MLLQWVDFDSETMIYSHFYENINQSENTLECLVLGVVTTLILIVSHDLNLMKTSI